jgi:nucleotide sugar dehydrogenase
MTTIGVVGLGFVGKTVARGFATMPECEIRGYDSDPSRSMHSLDEVLQCQFVFVCLPTPMESVEGGKCDTTIIEQFFAQSALPAPIYIIKSTVPVGTTRRMESRYGVRLIHNPEFLTERSADVDFVTSTRVILGGTNQCAMEYVTRLYQQRFPGIQILQLAPEESEVVKYATNAFLAAKAVLFNEFRLITDAMGLDWQTIHDVMLTDSRIVKTHTAVPGWDGRWGVGGKCFPKDLNALIATAEEAGVEPHVLRAVWRQNLAVRRDRDWARIPGAVTAKAAEAAALADTQVWRTDPHR